MLMSYREQILKAQKDITFVNAIAAIGTYVALILLTKSKRMEDVIPADV